MDKFKNKYRISSSRASWHDYNGGVYFITICTAGKEHYFGRIDQGKMLLNTLGEQLNTIIIENQTHNKYAEIPLFQIMPNHLHLIVFIDEQIDVGAGGKDVAYLGVRDAAYTVSRDAACHVSTG